ncbi:hypothetical protein [Ammoniphilus sp. YIM 78166]|uniref:hypothetical protein n=1 Tax=Ammoniphilus sp. YIM 78166 TaxID=1644106 RepID=UPI00107033E0|nr:hypothetical protein [Ammoniphilus sp. YIM 78166]
MNRNGAFSQQFALLAADFLQKGLAIEPILVPGRGELTRILLYDREEILPYTSSRFLRQLLEVFFLDIESLHRFVHIHLSKKQLLPLPITSHLVLFPLRNLRKDELKARGFLWLNHRGLEQIASVKTNHKHSELILANGQKIIVPYTKRFVQQQIRDSCLIEYFFQQLYPTFPHLLRPALIGQAPTVQPQEEDWQIQLLRIAESIRNYSSH